MITFLALAALALTAYLLAALDAARREAAREHQAREQWRRATAAKARPHLTDDDLARAVELARERGAR